MVSFVSGRTPFLGGREHVYAFGLPFLFAPVDVVEIGAVLVVFEVLQGGGLHADVELPAFTCPGRYPRKTHLPAVQVAREGEDAGGQLACFEVEASRERNAPFGRQVHASAVTQGLYDVLPRAGWSS